MAPLPDVPSVVRVALQGGITPSLVWVSRFYIAYTGTAPANADLNTFAGVARSSFNTNLKSLMVTSSTLNRVDAVDLTTVSSAVGADTTQVVGTRATPENPPQICVVNSYGIHRRYRGGHPRGYWPFGVAADVTDNTWSSAFITACNTGFNAFFAAVIAAPWSGGGTLTHVNVSYFKGFNTVVSPTTGRTHNPPKLRTTPVVDLVASHTTQASIGTQRRREAFVD